MEGYKNKGKKESKKIELQARSSELDFIDS